MSQSGGFGSSLFGDTNAAKDASLNKQFGAMSTNPNGSNARQNSTGNNTGFGASLNMTNSAFGATNSSSFGASLFGPNGQANNTQNQVQKQSQTQVATQQAQESNMSKNNGSNSGDDTIVGWGGMAFGNEAPPQQAQQTQQQQPQQTQQTQEQTQQQTGSLPNGTQSNNNNNNKNSNENEMKRMEPTNNQATKPLKSSGIDWAAQGAVSSNVVGAHYIHSKYDTFQSMGILYVFMLQTIVCITFFFFYYPCTNLFRARILAKRHFFCICFAFLLLFFVCIRFDILCFSLFSFVFDVVTKHTHTHKTDVTSFWMVWHQ